MGTVESMLPRGSWPVLRGYGGRALAQLAMPLGGIGTGTVSLGGRGDLRDFEWTNRPGKGFAPPHAFAALRVRVGAAEPVVRCLEGPIDLSQLAGAFGVGVHDHGLPRFRRARCDVAYPLAQVSLSDPDVPVRVRLEAFNPLVPADVDASSWPAAVLCYVVENPLDVEVEMALAFAISNVVGQDGSGGTPDRGRNQVRAADGVHGVLLSSAGVPTGDERWGTVAIATPAAGEVSTRTSWSDGAWGTSLQDFWDDFAADGRLDARAGSGDTPVASLAVATRLRPGERARLPVLLTWHFPNRLAWDGNGYTEPAGRREVVGNYYTTRFADAWDVAARLAPRLAELEARTVEFVGAFCAADLPAAVKEAALSNLSTLRTQTCFRTPDGRFFGWEGCADTAGCCHGSCTHVWNYEQATPFCFGELSRSLREVEFGHATGPDGRMSFRVNLPLDRAQEFPVAAADGQLGCLVKLYRDWVLCGDDALLRELWPAARRALAFCWIPGGWDADRDGVLEGAQHNTMDVEYFGPNPQMGGWYLAALRAGELMARAVGDGEFAATCADLFGRGRAWLDAHLFNGEYYEQQIRPPTSAAAVAPGLLLVPRTDAELADPDQQLGAGCLVDQLVGQLLAHVAGLGHLLDPEHVRAALDAVYRHNFKTDLWGHFNDMRSFALGDEAAVLMATYPRGNRPARPFSYNNEVMTGFEYTLAAGLLYEGADEPGLRIFDAVRARHDGVRRNPFDEAECGHHYARAMASWAGVLALTGFHYDGRSGAMGFAASSVPVRWFWSTGDAWGVVTQDPPPSGGAAAGAGTRLRLEVRGGRVRLAQLYLSGRIGRDVTAGGGAGRSAPVADQVRRAGDVVEATVP